MSTKASNDIISKTRCSSPAVILEDLFSLPSVMFVTVPIIFNPFSTSLTVAKFRFKPIAIFFFS